MKWDKNENDQKWRQWELNEKVRIYNESGYVAMSSQFSSLKRKKPEAKIETKYRRFLSLSMQIYSHFHFSAPSGSCTQTFMLIEFVRRNINFHSFSFSFSFTFTFIRFHSSSHLWCNAWRLSIPWNSLVWDYYLYIDWNVGDNALLNADHFSQYTWIKVEIVIILIWVVNSGDFWWFLVISRDFSWFLWQQTLTSFINSIHHFRKREWWWRWKWVMIEQ
jgi:hypothetical protein